jgi:chromate transporter
MLPVIQREIVERRGWLGDEKVAEYYALAQCLPGIIAINTAA